jgi:hypothetical protein
MKEKTLRYKFNMIHIPGAKNRTADAVSRHPTTHENERMVLPDDLFSLTSYPAGHPTIPSPLLAPIMQPAPLVPLTEEIAIEAAISSFNSGRLQSITWDRVRTATTSDPELVLLMDLVERGSWPAKDDLPQHAYEFYRFREHLHTIDGVLLYKNRIIIPPPFDPRCSVLSILLIKVSPP